MSHNRYPVNSESAQPIRNWTKAVKKGKKPVEILWKSCGKHVNIYVLTPFHPSFFSGLAGYEPSAPSRPVSLETPARF